MLPAEIRSAGSHTDTIGPDSRLTARLAVPQRYETMIPYPRLLCLIPYPAEALVSAGFFTVERTQILQNSTELCKICAFSVSCDPFKQKLQNFHKQDILYIPKYQQILRRSVFLPPTRAPPFLTFAIANEIQKWR